MAIKKLFQILNKKEQTKFIFLFFAVFIMGLLEVMGVASILPFMQLIANPNAIEQSTLLMSVYNTMGFANHSSMLIFFGVAIIVLIGITSIFSIYALWLQYKYSWDTAHGLSMRLLKSYLTKPYKYFLNKNTSEIQTYVISEVNSLIGGVLIPIIELVSRSMVSIFIFALLLMVDLKISLIMFGGLGGAYLVIYLSRQGFLRKIGKHRIDMNILRYKSLAEMLNGIKTVKVYGEQSFFYDRYEEASEEFCDVQPRYNLILAAPKYLLEFLAFGSILAITIYLFNTSGDIQSAIPRLSLYAVAGYRLLPALQKAFAAAAKYKHNNPILEKLHVDLTLGLNTKTNISSDKQRLPFHEKVQLSDIAFSYDEADQMLIKNLNLSITKGETVAFIGSTGSGKTTLVDLIVGLHTPQQGALLIDDLPVDHKNIRNWQNNIAYVPQDVFLFDDSVIRNIILGNNGEEADMDLLKKVTKMADIYDFIKNEMPNGFETTIGERGVRLSGGQRQRLGLARALYRQPSVLILDEATSALDSITEKGIIESLSLLPDDMTTIIIAHRLSTVRHADFIYFLKDGKINAKGSYDSLLASNQVFKTMVELS